MSLGNNTFRSIYTSALGISAHVFNSAAFENVLKGAVRSLGLQTRTRNSRCNQDTFDNPCVDSYRRDRLGEQPFVLRLYGHGENWYVRLNRLSI